MKKITISQIWSTVYLMVLANYLGTTSSNVINLAKQDAWFSIIFAFIIGIIPLLLYIKIMDYRPDLNICDKIKILLGRKLGGFINFLFLIFTFLLLIILFWNLDNFTGSQYLHRTPTLFIGFCGATCIIYLANQNIFTIMRTLFIMFIIVFSLYIFGTVGLLSQFNIENLKPYFENGFINPILGALLTTSYNILPLFLLTVIPKDYIQNSHKLGKTIITAYISAGLIMFSIVLLTIGIFGSKLSLLFQYTGFHLLKNISLFGFIDRIESTISIRWILYGICLITIIVYYIDNILKSTFKFKNELIFNILNIFLCISAVIMSELIFENNVVKNNFSMHILPYLCLIFFVLIPLLLYIIIRKKQNIS